MALHGENVFTKERGYASGILKPWQIYPSFVFKLLPNESGRPLSSFSDSETLYLICVIGQKVKRSHK